MSNLTAEEILDSLNNNIGKGFLTRYYEYDSELGEYIKHGPYPILREELPEDAPEFVKKNASDSIDIGEFLSEEYYMNHSSLDVEKVEDWGGEGEGDSAGVTLKIGDYFFQATWYYSSWDGSYYDDAVFYEVEPREVMVIKYVQV